MTKTTYEANQPVLIANTQINEIDGDSVSIPVSVNLQLFPWGVGVGIESDNYPAKIFKKEHFWISLRNFKKIKVMIQTYQIGGNGIKGTLIPTKQLSTVVKKRRRLQSVKFSILNFPIFFGQQDKWIEENNTSHRLGFAQIKASPWLIEISEAQNLCENLKILKSNPGFVITHTGIIKLSNGNTFSVKDVEDILSGLGKFLSFTHGVYSGLTLIEGEDRNGNKTWIQWGCSPYTKPWRDNQSKTMIIQTEGWDFISDVFPEFWVQFTRGDDWKRTIIRAIDWYLISNESALHVGIIITQAALERLSYQILGQKKGNTGEFIRDTLKKLNLDPQIPSSCSKLKKIQKANNLAHGPHTLIEIRNDFVHPKNKLGEITNDVLHESRNLGQRYIELILLKLFKYRGRYINRLNNKIELL